MKTVILFNPNFSIINAEVTLVFKFVFFSALVGIKRLFLDVSTIF